MTIEGFFQCADSLPASTHDTPFGPDTLVFRVGNKIFAIVGLDKEPAFANLKCDPEYAVELRERYDGITPGWHMNKTHWNSVMLSSDVPDSLIRELTRGSYHLIRASLPRKVRDTLPE